MADVAQEKTEQATPRKLEHARQEGQVARSNELNSVFIIGLGFLTIYLLGPIVFDNLGSLMKHNLSEAAKIAMTPSRVQLILTE